MTEKLYFLKDSKGNYVYAYDSNIYSRVDWRYLKVDSVLEASKFYEYDEAREGAEDLSASYSQDFTIHMVEATYREIDGEC